MKMDITTSLLLCMILLAHSWLLMARSSDQQLVYDDLKRISGAAADELEFSDSNHNVSEYQVENPKVNSTRTMMRSTTEIRIPSASTKIIRTIITENSKSEVKRPETKKLNIAKETKEHLKTANSENTASLPVQSDQTKLIPGEPQATEQHTVLIDHGGGAVSTIHRTLISARPLLKMNFQPHVAGYPTTPFEDTELNKRLTIPVQQFEQPKYQLANEPVNGEQVNRVKNGQYVQTNIATMPIHHQPVKPVNIQPVKPIQPKRPKTSNQVNLDEYNAYYHYTANIVDDIPRLYNRRSGQKLTPRSPPSTGNQLFSEQQYKKSHIEEKQYTGYNYENVHSYNHQIQSQHNGHGDKLPDITPPPIPSITPITPISPSNGAQSSTLYNGHPQYSGFNKYQFNEQIFANGQPPIFNLFESPFIPITGGLGHTESNHHHPLHHPSHPHHYQHLNHHTGQGYQKQATPYIGQPATGSGYFQRRKLTIPQSGNGMVNHPGSINEITHNSLYGYPSYNQGFFKGEDSLNMNWPKIFKFTDGRVNLSEFEKEKKLGRVKLSKSPEDETFDNIRRDSFLILHGGAFAY